MATKGKIDFKEFVLRHKRFSLETAQAHGFSRAAIAYHEKRGDVIRLARGIYADCVMDDSSDRLEFEALAECGYEFTVALFSALRIHGFTTANPTDTWIAMPQKARKPARVDFPLRITWLGETSYRYGRVNISSGGISYKVYSPAKTVADLFKFRNKYGVDVAIEALKEGWAKRLFTFDELYSAAEVCRVGRIIVPYMESIAS